MYPRNAASPERIAIGAVVQISDGAVQTSGVTVTVTPQGGAEGASGGTVAYSARGIVWYTPTQAETNYTSVIFEAGKAGCIPVSQTVVTTASATPGKVVLSGETHTSAVIPTVTTLTGHTAQTGDCFARLGAPTGASVSADVAAVKTQTAAIETDTQDIQSRIPAALDTGYMSSKVNVMANATIAASTFSASAIDAAALAANAVDEIAADILVTPANKLATDANGRVDLSAINGDTGSVNSLKRAVDGNVLCTVTTGATTTSIPCSSILPASAVADQFKGRIMLFADDTTTAALRGQATDITAFNHTTQTFTVTALTTAPASGDIFSIQ